MSSYCARFTRPGSSTNEALPGSPHGPEWPVSSETWWHTSQVTPARACSGRSISGTAGIRPVTTPAGEWQPEQYV